jgi:uncharacterized protein YbjT (DUF2867 family)
MSILIVGGTGTVGSATTNRLIEMGFNATVMTRSVDKFDNLPENAAGVVGNLEVPETLKTAFEGVESLFLITPLAENETEQGLNAVAAAKEAGVKRIVYMTVPTAENAKHIPHFKSKIPVVDAIKESGIEYTIIEPNNFMQNDFWFVQVIKDYGIYPQPIGDKGLTRVDVRDIADAAANALTMDGFNGEVYQIHGPEVLTGEGTVSILSEAFGKEIKYGGNDLVQWAEANKPYLPQWMIDDFAIMYQYFQDYGLNATAKDYERLEKILGHAPRSYTDFVKELVG